MSIHGQNGEPEYLSQGDEQTANQRSPRKAAVLVTVAVLVTGVVGVGAWGVGQFLGGGGPRPDSAVPAGAIAYVALDLDPSAGQKVEALKTMREFPALDKEIGGRDDIRELILGEVQEGCDEVTFAADVEPWLGDRAAFAAVRGADSIAPFLVVQVSDETKAVRGVRALADCVGEQKPGTATVGDYLLVAEDQETADDVAADAKDSPLSEDSEYLAWMDRVGEPGILTAYVAKDGPEALFGMMFGFGYSDTDEAEATPMPPPTSDELPPGMLDELESMSPRELRRNGFERDAKGEIVFRNETLLSTEHPPDEIDPSDEMTDMMDQLYGDFEGLAATIRFADGGLEASLVSKGMNGIGPMWGLPVGLGNGGASRVGELPSDTAAALGLGFSAGWLTEYLDSMDDLMGDMGPSPISARKELERTLGVTVPELETMLGSSVEIAVGPSVTAEALDAGGPEDLRGVDIAARIAGDPVKIEGVLDKLLAKAGPDADVVQVVAGDGMVSVGFDREYAASLLEPGKLGDSAGFREAVPDADGASSVLYVDFNAGNIESLVAGMFGDGDVENIAPLSAVGVSDHTDEDGYSVNRIRLTTD
jgi:hypothetical protein